MATFRMIFLLSMLFTTASAVEHYSHEAHNILKRMAEANEHFEGHDVARIFDVGSRRAKRLVRRDLRAVKNVFNSEDFNSLQLHLSSGSKVHLALVPAEIFSHDTVVSHQTRNGRTERKWEGVNCFSHGHLEDSSGKGLAAISHCNGIFGFAKSPGYDYFVYPLDAKRPKRDAGEDYDVHVMWRRSKRETNENITDSSTDNDNQLLMPTNDEIPVPSEHKVRRSVGESTTNMPYKNVVIELAMFADENFWNKLHRALPGREDDYMLTMITGTQALFGNPERVGYNIQIKVKLLEYWRENPTGYTFKESMPNNLRSFCKYTKRNYKYDVHALYSGISAWNKGLAGLAYVGGACTSKRCLVIKTFGLKSFSLLAHELGHTLKMPHQARKNCPKNEPYVGGFMGGGRLYNFSPCMKRHISKFLESSRSKCLYTESSTTKTSVKFSQMPNLFPGEIYSPDRLCKLLAGEGYNYVPLGKSLGNPTCRWMVCYNENETSDEFGRAKRMIAPAGFPCGQESFCVREWACKAWNITKTALDYEKLKETMDPPEWSEWSTEVSDCSRTCGTGVKTRRRKCLITGYNLAPYCPGMAVKPELCNTDPCPGDPDNKGSLRQMRGDEVCKRFFNSNVTLHLRKAKGYLPICRNLTRSDILKPASITDVFSRSCLMKCARNPMSSKGTLDAFMPDGTPCFDTERSENELDLLNIELRCVRGSCLEFPESVSTTDMSAGHL